MKFDEYFNSWLYSKDGYYSKYKPIGKDGDFYTSVSTSMFFGGSIGKKIVDLIKDNKLSKSASIVEIGAHHGYLLSDIIQFIYTLNPILLKTLNFVIVEKFEHLRAFQEKYLKESFSNNINIHFVDDISKIDTNEAFFISNEIFDAFACKLVYTKDEILKEGFVENSEVIFKKCEDKDLINHCKKYNIKKGEVSLEYEKFLNSLCEKFKNFHFITFDYGDTFIRNDFSLRVYKKHEVYAFFQEDFEFEKFYKNSDITYDVNFSHLKDVFNKNGIKNVDIKTQERALIEFGIIQLLELLKKNVDEKSYLKEAQKVKLLLQPSGMGDRFKMLYAKT